MNATRIERLYEYQPFVGERESLDGPVHIREVQPTARGNITETGVLTSRLPGSEVPGDIKRQYSQFVFDAVHGDTNPDESNAKFISLLVKARKSIDDFRADVGELKSFLNQRGLSPAGIALESLFKDTPSNPLLENLFR